MTITQMLATALAASKEEKMMTTWRCPCLLPPLLMVLLIVVVFDTTSLLPAVASVHRGILPTLNGNTQQRNRDHGGGIPTTARDGTNDIGGGGGHGRSSGNPKWRTMQPSRDNDGSNGGRGGNLLVVATVGNVDDNNVSNNTVQGERDSRPFSLAPPPGGDNQVGKHGV